MVGAVAGLVSRSPAPSSAGLLERDHQLGVIEDVLGDALAGRGATVCVVGEAGVGKSALLGEIAILGRQFMVLRARGDELECDYPYGVVRQLFEGALRVAGDGDAVFAGPAELARGVFDLAEFDASMAQDATFSHQHGLYWLTVQLIDQLGPLLLIVDDAHRADESSLRFLRFLSRRLDGLRVVLVLAARPPEQLDTDTLVVEMLEDPECRIVTVDRLSPAGTAEYLGLVWTPAAASLATVCHELSSGNPLMLRALVIEAQRTGVVPDAVSADELRTLGVRSIGQRVERLLGGAPPAALALAQAIAILGADVPPSSAIELAGVRREDAAPALDVLLRLGLLEEVPTGLRFAHPLVRASVYMLMSPVERQDAHTRAARTLHESGADAEEVAAHLIAAGPTREPWMAAVLERAAEHALALGVPETAARFLARAVEHGGEDARLLARLANAESHAGLTGGLDHYRRAIAAATTDHAAELELQYAGALAMAGQTTKAFDVLLAVAAPGDPPAARAALHAAALFTRSPAAFAHRDVVAAGIAAEAASLAAADDPGSRLLSATYAFERAVRGDPVDAVRTLIEPTVRGGGLPLDMRATSPWGYGIWALILSDRGSEALRECDHGVEQGRRSGQLVLLALALCLRAGVHLRHGSLLLAEADCVESLELARYPSWRFGAAACTQFLVEILLEQGRTAEARAAFGELSAAQRNPDTIAVELLVRTCHARLLLAERAAERALVEALDLGRCADEGRFGCVIHIPWRTIGASAAAALGDIEQARALAADHLRCCKAFGVRGAIADALLVQATLAPDDERRCRLDETLKVARTAGAPLSLAKVLVAAAREMRVTGRIQQARELAREASKVASQCAAMPVVDAALDELAASGARPRRRGGAGPHLLTASENRVARLAADGASNREIAQTLFVTQKTVEGHLSAAYRKLSISSRAQLTSRLSST
jgi:DNA-binding CsgD family transcriptional regulator